MPTNFPTSVDVLVNPTPTDSLNAPAHSTQHANANDAIEAIEDVLVPAVNAWTAWTPTFLGASLGNGTISAFYSKLGKVVTIRIRFLLGSTSTVTSQPRFSLPFNAIAAIPIASPALLINSGSGNQIGIAGTSATTHATVSALNAAGTYLGIATITNTVPFTWAVNDVMEFTFTYEAA